MAKRPTPRAADTRRKNETPDEETPNVLYVRDMPPGLREKLEQLQATARAKSGFRIPLASVVRALLARVVEDPALGDFPYGAPLAALSEADR